ncbi:BamA/TamA family outer membrane protein [Hymenobacter busanensis]|uniref:BamA/TamA family outer membrane protein n=1 Tax=Hymenobacter busanensis TaxID=2607656 RepID=A0A7L4ZWW3_9BACT|nr:BamA/TamA family outer membrane protein [Hymenobacter busanensis]KAA9325289.1 BamA/TamA family outer membrane protein [Hymenobacter busanensis]QHJ07718.1 BamA/TamA family outer membrane protein [Hymenobacter busanensis]
MRSHCLLLALGVLAAPVFCKAQARVVPADSAAARPAKPARKVKVAALPIVFSQPETGIAYGAAVLPVWRFGTDTATRSSTARLLGYYTQRKQSSVSLTYTIFTPGERWALNGEAFYFNFPYYYYGVGNDTRKAEKSDISYKVVIVTQRVLKNLRPHTFAGLSFRLTDLHHIRLDDPLTDDGQKPNLLLERPARERQTTLTSGLGPTFLYDSRDNVLSTWRGSYLETTALLMGRYLGSDNNFTRFQLDARHFRPLRRGNTNTVLAGQVQGQFHTGTVPFRELANLGGEKMLRGIYEGRFRDRQMVAAQLELRQKLFWRLGGVVFGAAGQVHNSLGDFRPNDFNVAAGAGLRIAVNRQDRLAIRIDYAVGSGQSSGLYFAFNEAF